MNQQVGGRGEVPPEDDAVMVTVTGAIVNRYALDEYNGAYLIVGSRDAALALLWIEAVREDWARDQVRKAGQSWTTHMAKFSGTVVPR